MPVSSIRLASDHHGAQSTPKSYLYLLFEHIQMLDEKVLGAKNQRECVREEVFIGPPSLPLNRRRVENKPRKGSGASRIPGSSVVRRMMESVIKTEPVV